LGTVWALILKEAKTKAGAQPLAPFALITAFSPVIVTAMFAEWQRASECRYSRLWSTDTKVLHGSHCTFFACMPWAIQQPVAGRNRTMDRTLFTTILGAFLQGVGIAFCAEPCILLAMVPKSIGAETTLDDLERPLHILLHKISVFRSPARKFEWR